MHAFLESYLQVPYEIVFKSPRFRYDLILTISFRYFSLDVSIGEKMMSTILGDMIWEEMSDCIIRECLLYSIPANSSQLGKYSEVRGGIFSTC